MKSIVTLTITDLIDAKKLSIRPRRGFLIVVALLLVLTAVFIVTGVFGTVSQKDSDYSWLWALLIFAYLGFIYYRVVYASSKKQFRQNKLLAAPVEVELTEDSFRTNASYGQTEIKFADFHKWKANEKVLLLYHSDAAFNVIPSRAFANEAERQAALANIGRYCAKRK